MENFKLSVADVLLLVGIVQQKKSRPSQIQIDAEFDRKSKISPAAPIPNKAIPGDKIDHWIEYTQKNCDADLILQAKIGPNILKYQMFIFFHYYASKLMEKTTFDFFGHFFDNLGDKGFN